MKVLFYNGNPYIHISEKLNTEISDFNAITHHTPHWKIIIPNKEREQMKESYKKKKSEREKWNQSVRPICTCLPSEEMPLMVSRSDAWNGE